MSGHSKWSTIKRQKGAADAQRSALFMKLAKLVTIAAREGGGDPEFNFKLRTAIDQAKAVNVPKDNIERAIKRGTSFVAGEKIEEVIYEGYGPGGAVAVLIEALTDNRNRTSANLKHIFAKYGGNLAASGAVQWMFVQKGVIRAESDSMPSDDVQLELIDAGAEDMSLEDGELVIAARPESLSAVNNAAKASGIDVGFAGVEWVAKDIAPVPANKDRIVELLEALDGDEDISALYTNIEL